MSRVVRLILLALYMMMLVTVPAETVSAQGAPLTVFAAASLTDAFTEIAETVSQQLDKRIILNFAGTSTLVSQIMQGAQADILASANEVQMQTLIDSDFVNPDTVEIFAENELILVIPATNPADVTSVFDLVEPGVLLVLAAPGVPVRAYTDELFATLENTCGTEWVNAIYDNLVSEESNVRQVSARVALGEADAGIVYRTDVTADIAEDVQILELPEHSSPVAQYPIAPLMSSTHPDAEVFIEFLLSSEGQEILQRWGFRTPDDLLPEATLEITPEVTPETTAEAENFVEECP